MKQNFILFSKLEIGREKEKLLGRIVTQSITVSLCDYNELQLL